MTGERGEPLPLYDHAAERAVIGAAMLSADTLGDLLGTLTADDFHDTRHATIWRTLVTLWTESQPTDPTTVHATLTANRQVRTGHLDAAYLHACVETCPSPSHAHHYARIVADRATLARIDLAGTRIRAAVQDSQGDPNTAAEKASAALHEALTSREPGGLTPFAELVPPTFDAMREARVAEGPTGISTGLLDLDQITGGLRPGQLVLIAARPAMGKSILAADIARAVALRDHQPVAFFSLEMGRTELMMRLLAAECSVPVAAIIKGHVIDRDWARLETRAEEIGDAPLHIDDSTDLSLLDIRTRTRRLAARHGVSLVVIDYLQLMRVAKARDQREREVAELSRGLKLLAKELEVPVVAVAQLNRGPEGRASHKPMLSDLRESGSLEADADVVMLLHRPDYYDHDSPRKGEVDIDVAKNRNGAQDTITAAAQLHFTRFANISQDEPGGN